jgi:hypothetical protein
MSLINRFPLMANGNDIIGSLTATNNGSVTFSTNNGANFNGTNQWLSYSVAKSGYFSMLIWLKPSVFNATQGTFVFCSSGGINSRGFQVVSSGVVNYIAGSAAVASSASTDWNATNYPSTSFTMGTVTWDGTALKGYRNNTLVASLAASSVGSVDSNLSIGRLGAYAGQYYQGYALDARYYDHALSTTEIAALQAAGPNSDFARMIYSPIFVGG